MIKLGQLLDAVEVRNVVPSAYPEVYKLGWTIARYGRGLVGLEDNPVALGRELLRQTDFFECRSGLLDTHRVVFDLPDILDGENTNATLIRRHLEWMVDSRRNPETIRLILTEIQHCGGVRGDPAYNKELVNLRLQGLAEDLSKALSKPSEAVIAKALLEGNLYKVRAELSARDEVDGVLAITVRRTYILWCLFDLQVMAARLFHAEWNALETGGMHDPRLVSVRAVKALVSELLEWAEKIEKAFKAGASEREISESLRQFIKEHDLEAHARRNGELMDFSPEELDGDEIAPEKRRKLMRFLNEVRDKARELEGGFDAALQNKPQLDSRLYHARRKGHTTKEKRAIQPTGAAAVKLLLEANASASSIRFSMPVLTALTYSVHRVVETIGSLPAGVDIIDFDGTQGDHAQLLGKKQRSALRDNLVGIYRNLFVRDHYRLGKNKPKLSDDGHPPVINEDVASRLDPKTALLFGAHQEPAAAISNGLGISAGQRADLKVLENYHRSDDREPEEEFIDWVFEASLSARLSGPLKKRSIVRDC